MTKILNLDEFAPEEARITYKGQEFELESLNLENYLRFLQLQDKVDEESKSEASIAAAQDLIALTVPSLPTEEIGRMPFQQLFKLVQFVSQAIQQDFSGFFEETAQAKKKSET